MRTTMRYQRDYRKHGRCRKRYALKGRVKIYFEKARLIYLKFIRQTPVVVLESN